MPKKIKTRRVASKARRNPNGRTDKKKQGRKRGRGPAPANTGVIANSFFALTLPKLKGFDVEDRKSNIGESLPHHLQKIYRQLNPKGTLTVKKDASVSEKSSELVKLILKEVPDDATVYVDNEDQGTHFEIVHQCKYVNYLPVMIVGKTLTKLKTDYPKLHDLFVLFLSAFIKSTKIEWWGTGMFDMSLDRSKEMLEYESEEMDPDVVDKLKIEIDMYEKGAPKEYETAIRSNKKRKRDISVEFLLSSLKKLRKKHPVIEIIKQGCMLIRKDADMYIYRHEGWEQANMGDAFLAFDCQANILWETGSFICEEFDQWIEMEVNEGGLADPILSYKLEPGGKMNFDRKSYDDLKRWPLQLAEFLNNSAIKLHKYAK